MFAALKVLICRCKTKKIKCEKCHSEMRPALVKRSSSAELREDGPVLKKQRSSSIGRNSKVDPTTSIKEIASKK